MATEEKPKKDEHPAAGDQSIPSILEMLNIDDPDKKKAEEAEAKKGDGLLSAEDAKGLQTRLDRLERDNDALRRASLTSAAMPAAPHAAVGPAKPTPVEVNLSGLPSPMDDSEAYSKGLNERLQTAISSGITGALAAHTETADRRINLASRGDALWEDFSDTYPAYALHKKQAEFAAGQVTGRLKRRGVDIDAYMYGSSVLFMEDVVSEMDTVFGKEKFAAADAKTGKDGEKKADPEVSRTVGVFGGIEGTGKENVKAEDETAGDMIKDIQDLQRTSGFF